MTIRPSAVTLAAVLTLGLSATPLMAQGNLGNPAALTEQAPATYKARFDTSKGAGRRRSFLQSGEERLL